MGTKTVRENSKFARYMKGPSKILARARDFYVRSLTSCAGHEAYGNVMGMGCPTPQFATLPRSLNANSVSSNYSSRDDDLRELIRIASTRSLAGKVESAKSSSLAVARSRTVAIGPIDEDKPCEFGMDHGGERAELIFPRSKSCEVAR